MKRLSVLSSALLLVGAAAFGQGLTQADRERGVQYLDQIRNGVVAATTGLSDAQLKFKAAPDRWSVAETLEHIAKSEEFLFQNVTDKVVKAPRDRQAATRQKPTPLSWQRFRTGPIRRKRPKHWCPRVLGLQPRVSIIF